MRDLLAIKNKHSRDKNITFKDEGHEYTVIWDGNKLGDKSFTSTTTFVHQFVTPFNADLTIKNMKNSKNWNSRIINYLLLSLFVLFCNL